MTECITLDSDRFKELIHNSAALRGQRHYSEAIKTVETNLNVLAPDCLENAYLEIIYAATEGGIMDIAQKYATLLAAIDPNIPIVKSLLSQTT